MKGAVRSCEGNQSTLKLIITGADQQLGLPILRTSGEMGLTPWEGSVKLVNGCVASAPCLHCSARTFPLFLACPHVWTCLVVTSVSSVTSSLFLTKPSKQSHLGYPGYLPIPSDLMNYMDYIIMFPTFQMLSDSNELGLRSSPKDLASPEVTPCEAMPLMKSFNKDV